MTIALPSAYRRHALSHDYIIVLLHGSFLDIVNKWLATLHQKKKEERNINTKWLASMVRLPEMNFLYSP
jgi:hypothetical protein